MGPRVAMVVAFALVAVACGGGDADGLGAPVVETPTEDARLDVVDERAQYHPGDEEWTAAQGGEPLAEGFGVRTDRQGFAQVVYHDGSLTRLGPRTSFTVVALGEPGQPPDIEVELGLGDSWHRVVDRGDEGRYEVRTAVGTAAVRGTTFVVSCPVLDLCRFRVLDGVVAVDVGGALIEVTAGVEVTVTADGALPPLERGVDELRQEPWTSRNLALDAGEDDPGGDPGADAGGNGEFASPITIPARGFDGTATFLARREGGPELTDVFRDVSVTLDLDPAEVAWIAWNDEPGLVAANPDGSGELVLGPGENNLGVNDSLRVTVTNPAGVSRTVEVDVNDPGGVPQGVQAVLLGDASEAPDVIRAGIGLPAVALDEAGAFDAALFDRPGAYTFRFEALDSQGGGGGHVGMWLLIATRNP